jgi:membrane-associated PAP2 superfamily phosphatase
LFNDANVTVIKRMSRLDSSPLAMRENSPFRRLGLFTVLALLALLTWDFSGLDLSVMHWIASPQGFAMRHNWWLEHLLHDRVRHAAVLAYLGVLVMVWLPMGRFRNLHQIQRFEIWAGITLGLVLIYVLKRYSLTSCPWDLADFGGVGTYVSHWNWSLRDGGSGHCFPGGHASSALAFLALCLPWLSSGVSDQRRQGLRLLIGVLALGVLLGAVQTLRGAHYPSHTLWTGWMCWSIAVVNHMAFAWLARKRAAHGH